MSEHARPYPLPAWTRLVLFLYNLAFPLVFLFMTPGFLRRMWKRGSYRHKFGQRFGIYSARTRERIQGREWVWIHAVSVGEVLIAVKLAARLREKRPELQIVLSTTTSTGFKLAADRRAEWMEVIYNPIDFLPFVKRALNLIRPSQLILVEAEVWPNLVAQAWKRGVPVSLVNARLSPRSEGRFRKFRSLTGPLFRLLDRICVQEPEDVARWESLGVPEAAIHWTGSIKFDSSEATTSRAEELRGLLAGIGVRPDDPILLGGSTHPGEEGVLAEIYSEVRRKIPGLFLILVPRHFERAGEAVEAARAAGLCAMLRTELTEATALESKAERAVDCLIVDTTGELRDWYELATVVFVGKSLPPARGGQNPVEAASAGKPVVFGPHMENFEAAVRILLRRKGAIEVADSDSLRVELERLLGNEELRAKLSVNAKAAMAYHQGATERTVELLLGGAA